VKKLNEVNIAFLLLIGLCYKSPYALVGLFLIYAAHYYTKEDQVTKEVLDYKKAMTQFGEELSRQKDIIEKLSSKIFMKDLMKK